MDIRYACVFVNHDPSSWLPFISTHTRCPEETSSTTDVREPQHQHVMHMCAPQQVPLLSLSLSEQQLPHLSPHYQMERALLLCYLIKYTRSDATELPAHIAPLRICYTPTSRTGLLLAIKEAQLFWEGPFLPYLMVFIQRLYQEYQERVEWTFLNSPQSDTDTDEHLLLHLKRHHPHRE